MRGDFYEILRLKIEGKDNRRKRSVGRRQNSALDMAKGST